MAETPRPDRSLEHLLAAGLTHEGEDPLIQAARMEVIVRDSALQSAAAYKRRAESAEANAAQWREIATTDSLTGLANRLQITSKLEDMVNTKPGRFAIWFIDVDGLKTVNDTEGHEAGNQLIRRVADALRPGNTFYGRMPARLSGDEFVVIEEIDPDSDVSPQDQLTIKNHFLKESLEAAGIEASTGATLHTEGQSATELIELADQAMYQDKQERKAERAAESEAERRAQDAEDRTTAWATLSPEERAAVEQARMILGSVAISAEQYHWLVADNDQQA